MIIHQRGKDAEHKSNPYPRCLAFDEKINVAMTVARVRAGAEKHYDADHKQSQHCEKKDVGALTMHG